MTLTQTLITMLNNETSEKRYNIPLLIEHARKNKVLLQLLRNLGIEGPLRQKQEMALDGIHEKLMEVAKRIQHLDYAVIKFFKPMAYVPSDIDLLVKREQMDVLLRALQHLGYRPTVVEPNCVTLEGKAIIDVYINPDVLNIPYMRGEKLLEFAVMEEVDGVKIKKLRKEAEVVMVLSHAVYKEQIITLNDYYTTKFYVNSECVRIAERFNVSNAVAYSLRAFRNMELGNVEAPVKIPAWQATKLFLTKIVEDPLSKRFLPYVCLKLFDRRAPMLIKSRLFRRTY